MSLSESLFSRHLDLKSRRMESLRILSFNVNHNRIRPVKRLIMHPIARELFLSEARTIREDEKRERNIPGKGAEGTEVRGKDAERGHATKDAVHGYPQGTEREKYRTKNGRVGRSVPHFRKSGLLSGFVYSKSLPINGPFTTSSYESPVVRLRLIKLFPTMFPVLLNLVCFRFLFLCQDA
jgi:hypothetical protein